MFMKLIVKEYINLKGVSTFQEWFKKLDAQTAARITTALYRLETGNDSKLKSLGAGIYEYKLYFGSGYRIYFGKEGPAVIILLCAGNKGSQKRDITLAKKLWGDYKLQKTKNMRYKQWH